MPRDKIPAKAVRAIVVDPLTERVFDKVVVPTETCLSKVIGCQAVQLRVPMSDHVAYTHADIRHPLEDRYFTYNEILFSGITVFVSMETGDHSDSTLSVEEVASKVRWAYPVLARDSIRFAVEA